ncbi:MAG TPA: TatD family deoxyribonuclease, partial [Alphaproteobacteria bacterium]|nr:TatD family deoxyribonuclease [Alphaproteobacteria bacterium]
MFDSHAHLDFPQFDKDREEVLRRAAEAGVTDILVPGVDVATSERALLLAEEHTGICAAVGIHPNS